MVEKLRNQVLGYDIQDDQKMIDAAAALLDEAREDRERIEWLQRQSELGRDWIDFDNWDPDKKHIRTAIDETMAYCGARAAERGDEGGE